MKVGLVCDWYGPRLGGIESQLRDLAQALRARGHDAHVITATPGEDRDGGVPVHRLAVSLLPGVKTIHGPASLDQLDALQTRERFDVLHGHSLYSPLALAAMWLARRRGVASVLTSHSLLDPAARLVLRSIERRGWIVWPDVLAAVSGVSADDVRSTTGRSEVLLLPNGIDPAAWSAGERPRRDPVGVVSVLRLNRRKRPLALVAAAAAVRESGRDVQLTIVGDGPLRPALEREVRALGLLREVRLTGAAPRAEVRRYLAEADLFVFPAIKEAFGIAVLEARAAGLPVIAMRGSGAAELVEHGRDGLLAESDRDLAVQLGRLCGDELLRRHLQSNATRGLERFSWDRVTAAHLAAYELALGRARGDASVGQRRASGSGR